MSSWDDDDDDGLPDGAFTEDELAAGVQHIMRTGDPNATSSGRRPISWNDPDDDTDDDHRTQEAHDLLSSRASAPLRFETYAQARAWSQANPGKVFTRAADGQGFESKHVLPMPLVVRPQGVSSSQRERDLNSQRINDIKALAPHLHDVLSNSASNGHHVHMRPFYRHIWEDELSRLNATQLSRLRLLVAVHLAKSRERLGQLYAATQRYPRMLDGGHYGVDLKEQLSEFMEESLKDIDQRLPDSTSHDDDWDIPF